MAGSVTGQICSRVVRGQVRHRKHKSSSVLFSGTLPTGFMTKMKRRNVGASKWKGQILSEVSSDFSEDRTELYITSCLSQWLNT